MNWISDPYGEETGGMYIDRHTVASFRLTSRSRSGGKATALWCLAVQNPFPVLIYLQPSRWEASCVGNKEYFAEMAPRGSEYVSYAYVSKGNRVMCFFFC